MKFNTKLTRAVSLALAMLFVFTACSFAQQAALSGNTVQGIENNTDTNVNAANTGTFVQEVDTTPLSGNTANSVSSGGVTTNSASSGGVIIERVTRLDKNIDCVVTADEVPFYNQPTN